MGYIVTFDKLNSQLGFKGDLRLVQDVFPKGSQMYGYISMGLIGLAILLGLCAYCSLGQSSQVSTTFDTIEIPNTTNRTGNSNKGRLKQAML